MLHKKKSNSIYTVLSVSGASELEILFRVFFFFSPISKDRLFTEIDFETLLDMTLSHISSLLDLVYERV